MSKKQSKIKTFFQPKAKNFILSSKPLHIKSWSCLKSSKGNVNNNLDISSSTVISLLSSDEEDNNITEEKENIEEENNPNPLLNCPTNDEFEMKESSQVSPPSESSHNSLHDKSVELAYITEFLDVVIQEDAGSFDTEKKELSEESTDYKLNNFSSMIDWVLNDESNYHLFNEDDWTVINNFKSMSVRSQRLYVRLYVRKHRWIRSSKISYPELGDDMKEICDELVQKRLLLPCK